MKPSPTTTASSTTTRARGSERAVVRRPLHDASKQGDQGRGCVAGREVTDGEQLAELGGEGAGVRGESLDAGVGEPELEPEVKGHPLGVEHAGDVRALEVEQEPTVPQTERFLYPGLRLHDPIHDPRRVFVAGEDCRQGLGEGSVAPSCAGTVDAGEVLSSHGECTLGCKDFHEVGAGS